MTRTTLKLKPATKATPQAASRTPASAARKPATATSAMPTSAPRAAATRPVSPSRAPARPDRAGTAGSRTSTRPGATGPRSVARPSASATPRPRPSPQPLPDRGERLSKRVMQLRNCSRKEAEQYIEGGWVQVNGVVVEEPQHRVEQERITVDPNASLMALSAVTLILNKPAGYTDGLEELPPPRAGAARAVPRKAVPPNARSLLTPEAHWAQDASGVRTLKRHFLHLEADVELENGATGLVVFTQDWRTTRKLTEDLSTMEQEYLVEVKGEVPPEALKPISHTLKDDRLDLPAVKVSVNSSTPALSRLRFAVKGSHPGLIAYLCAQAQFDIVAMRRIRLGRVALADLPVGQWRYLAGHEKF